MSTQTIKADEKKIREYLASGMHITFSGSDQQNKFLLLSLIQAYIRQRRTAAKTMADRQYAMWLYNALYKIEKHFERIESWNYWRHCLQVRVIQETLHRTLPAPKGGHRKIRRTMETLMEVCAEVCSVPPDQYYKTKPKTS